MNKAREELQRSLNALDEKLGHMVRARANEVDFWSHFACEADAIEDAAHNEDYVWVMNKLDAILINHGKAVRTDVVLPNDHVVQGMSSLNKQSR